MVLRLKRYGRHGCAMRWARPKPAAGWETERDRDADVRSEVFKLPEGREADLSGWSSSSFISTSAWNPDGRRCQNAYRPSQRRAPICGPLPRAGWSGKRG